MPYTADGKTLMLDALRGGNPAANRGIATASLHTAEPDDAGSNEVTGGGYARQAVTVSAANAELAGSLDITNAPAFTLTDETVTHVGFWSGEGTPKFLAWATITPYTCIGAGILNLFDADLNLNL